VLLPHSSLLRALEEGSFFGPKLFTLGCHDPYFSWTVGSPNGRREEPKLELTQR